MTETGMWPEKSKIFTFWLFTGNSFLTHVLENYASRHKHTDTNNHSRMSVLGMEQGSKRTPNLRVMS